MPLFFWAEAKAAEPSKDFASESSVSVSSATESLPFPSTSAVTRPGPSREEIGRATWTLLHSIASYYPEKPTRQQQKDVKRFVRNKTRSQTQSNFLGGFFNPSLSLRKLSKTFSRDRQVRFSRPFVSHRCF